MSDTATPRLVSSARAVSRSVTTSCSDGAARRSSVPVISTGPITTEQADPGGVMCTTRSDGLGWVSASSRKPSLLR
jgi:hypothetical protein